MILFVDLESRLISFSGLLYEIPDHRRSTFILQLSIREVARHFPKIGYTTLQGRLSGRVVGYGHVSGGKGRGRVLPPDTR